ncbi:hypothetical protein [Pseudomonas tohonis]|uniref:hypothetical protein n=1 Tax=Pseudomonas tohonis TaxID=2725477 RepID=UPI001F3E6D74|nr:hypothetical protein [Pseudomonas tohonis]
MLIDLFYAMKDEYRLWREGPPAPSVQRPSPPPPAPPLESSPLNDLPAVKNWSHPFGDTSSVFQQLATLAKAQSGYFPLGRNGLWHGGVHFDSGTAGTAGPQGQSFVRCLADGEVIAYRIPEQTPKTTFFPAPGVTMKAPFATGFVLVRHRLEAPKIEGIADAPPSLIFYSLYMHLADWASYLTDPEKPRPAFWPESNQYRVKTDTDFSPVRAGERGLNLRHAPTQGKTIGFLPQGTAITVSGEGAYRKVEGIKGPVKLQNPDGTLQGYVGFSALLDLGGGAYQVNTTRDALRVRPTPDTSRDKIFELPSGTEITISGEGDFRKLESVVQYVHLASLEGERVPERGKVVVLDKPRPIKAGDLIGHLGPYQESNEETPQERLHLEVFACENVEAFFARSRQWADQMPEKARTWLKLEKGTTVVVHQPGHSHSAPPNLGDPHVASGAKLLIPRTELDGLSADRKIAVPATETSKARNWYRLDDLLIDAAGKDIPMGWICDEVGVTPWVSPWSWDGYEVIYNDDPPQNALAHFLLNMGDYFDGKEMEQWKPLADSSDRGPVRERLFEIIDADRDGKITTDEIQKALKVPAYAQSISQLVIHYESEWFYQQRKWDALDKVLGHTGSTPILNWVAEKERIKELSWWGEAFSDGQIPSNGMVYHLDAVGLVGWADHQSCACNREITETEIVQIISSSQLSGGMFQSSIYPTIRGIEVGAFLRMLNGAMGRFGINECLDKAFFIANLAVESDYFRTTEEYRNRDGAIPSGWYSYRGGHDYHGRGLIQLTHIENYTSYFESEGLPSSTPVVEVASSPRLVTGSAGWYWRNGSAWGDLSKFSSMNDFLKTIIGVNGGFNHAAEREEYVLGLIERLGVGACSTHGFRKYGKYRFSESSLAKSKNGKDIWEKYFGDSDEIFKR